MKNLSSLIPLMGRATLALIAAAALAANAMAAGAQFAQPDASFSGQVRVVESPVVYPGNSVKIAGSDFKPGQQVRFFHEGVEIVAEPATADAEGAFTVETDIPPNAVPGRHSIVVSVTNPGAALVYPLKVSPEVALSGAEQLNTQSKKLVTGLYQSAYSPKSNAVFVAAAVGRPPIAESTLVKVDPDTLEIIAQATPGEAPSRKNNEGEEQPGGLYGIYGIGVDDANGTVWVTNTRQNTVAVYQQSDLALVKQFEPGVVGHGRDIVIDAQQGKAYASTAFSPAIEVFDTSKLAHVGTIEPQTTFRGRDVRPFGSMSLALDQEASRLYVVSGTGEVAIINTQNDTVEKVIAVDGVFSSSGVAFDPATKRIFVASQGSDNLAIVDAESGATLHNVLVGANPLNVAFDPVSKLAYVSNRGSGTVTAVNADGEIVANLAGGPQPNHAAVGANGVVYVVNKGSANAADSNHILRIQRK